MLDWLYEQLMAIITFILGLFGLSLDKKSVTFAEDTKNTETKMEDSTENKSTESTE
jgi:hypothetical protein